MIVTIIKVCFVLYLSITATSVSGEADTLTPGKPLSDDDNGGAFLISAGGNFKLGFFTPAGSDRRYVGIWYNKIPVQTVVWVANRKRPVVGRSGSLSFSADGRLVITDENSTLIWSSNSPALSNPLAQLLDDGNLVVRGAGGDADSFEAWQSFDFPSDTLLPGMKLGWDLRTGLDHNVTSWRSDSDPSPGQYVSGIDKQGVPQLFLWSGTRKYWRGGPWNGLYFSGTPDMVGDDLATWYFVADSRRAFFSYQLKETARSSLIARFCMTPSGVSQRMLWDEGSKAWNVIRVAPRDECDSWSPCGPNSFCSPNESQLCSCLPGYRPRNPANWDVMVWSDGCVRKTHPDCVNGTDGFIKRTNLKLPDTSEATVDWSGSVTLEECRASCLRNCSCTAYASANISGGSGGGGCIIWTTNLSDIKSFYGKLGQDLYVRVAAADLGSGRSKRGPIIVIVTVSSAVAIFCLAAVAFFIRRRRRTECFTDVGQTEQGNDLNLPLFELGSIVEATGNFSNDNKLGEGGFGPVYKGKLSQGQEIAVKRLSTTSSQGVDEFRNEVKLIAKLQHRNLVRLLGYCIQGSERMLIYEYMPNGSLDTFIFDRAKSEMLSWRTRYDIIMGIARGLLYLHQDSRYRIIHRDLKASNILLDNDMNPKISDFGMARLFGGDEKFGKTKRVVGTYGYMSPEYVMHGAFSTSSDVFSFGVLVLEIICGRKNNRPYYNSAQQNLLEHMWNMWREGNALQSIDDGSTDDAFSVVEILRCINVGLLCVQERPEDRPTMSSVVLLLSSDTAQLPEPKRPGFIMANDPSGTNSSMSKEDSSCKNNVSITVLEGR